MYCGGGSEDAEFCADEDEELAVEAMLDDVVKEGKYWGRAAVLGEGSGAEAVRDGSDVAERCWLRCVFAGVC